MIDFIFMLTRQDQTILDCLDVFQSIRGVGLRHVGFKDVGVERETLKRLNGAIKDAGAESYLEVVSTTDEDCLRSAENALYIGINRVLGGTNVEPILKVLEGSGIEYLPFPGRPEGHPTKLGGTPESVAADCRRFTELGCAGVDLLAYRATEADPLDLIRGARGALTGRLVVAGSIDSTERIHAVAEAGADAFTIGTAALEGAFSPRKGGLHAQLEDILAACETAGAAGAARAARS